MKNFFSHNQNPPANPPANPPRAIPRILEKLEFLETPSPSRKSRFLSPSKRQFGYKKFPPSPFNI